ncbi:uncharacterized protein [Littorina saxatilis]|uniref:Uncharacterized protein n=1 Tax=Littorina saxatilis TaxID=31220 RepID=A0AAN9GLX2_9CAEN
MTTTLTSTSNTIAKTTTVHPTTTHKRFFNRLSVQDANIVTGVIGGFILIVAVTVAFFARRKFKSEKRHFEHKIHGELDKSLSVTSDMSEPYTANPMIQEIIKKQSVAIGALSSTATANNPNGTTGPEDAINSSDFGEHRLQPNFLSVTPSQNLSQYSRTLPNDSTLGDSLYSTMSYKAQSGDQFKMPGPDEPATQV